MSEIYRVLKPGAYAAVFVAKKTYDLLCISMRLAGFEIKDQLQWIHSQGSAKSRSSMVSGQDFRTDVRAKYEPIVLAQKPIMGATIKENLKRFGAGGLSSKTILGEFYAGDLIIDGSPESISAIHSKKNGVAFCSPLLDGQYDSAIYASKPQEKEKRLWLDGCGVGKWDKEQKKTNGFVNQNEAAEYNFHPTRKPILLMSHLVRLLTNEGATILDCYAGSGTTGVSAALNNRNFIGIDLDPNYLEISKHRIWNALERLKNPKADDYRYFCHFIDPEIIKRQEVELREKILSGEADFSERLVYQHLFSALAWISEKKAA
jgi:site-specific DNA-methyltransferase (adenine-specific)